MYKSSRNDFQIKHASGMGRRVSDKGLSFQPRWVRLTLE